MKIQTSPLVEMAAEAKRPTRWWVAWLIGIVIILAGLIIGDLVAEPLIDDSAQDAPIRQFGDIFSFGAMVVLLFLWLRFKEQRPFASVGLRGANPIGKLVGGVAIGAGMMSVGVLVLWTLGQYELGASVHSRYGMDAVLWLIPLLFIFIVQGSAEELLTRGYMLQTAGLHIPIPVAIIGASLIFGALHLDFEPVPFLNIILYAVLACFIALADGSLWRICGIHAGWNFFQGNIYGLPVSGTTEGASLWNFGPANGANELITGGTFGVEASLMGTVVLVTVLAISIAYYRRQEAQRAGSGAFARQQ